MPLTRQTSFAAGELAPTLYSRDDLAAYQHGLRTCRNFFISPHGAAVSRPGTTYVETVNNVFIGNDPLRLVPFQYSDNVAYVLAFVQTSSGSGLYVIRDGAKVHEVTIPFLPTGNVDLYQMKTSQVGAVLYISHPDFAPYTLTYGGTDTAWTFAAVDFDLEDVAGAWPALVLPPPQGTSKREWHWKATQIIQYPSGLRRETAAMDLTREFDGTSASWPASFSALSTDYYELKAGDIVSADHATDGDQAEIDLTLQGALADPGYEILSWRLYRGVGKLFGLVGEQEWSYSTSLGSNRLLDFGDDPDYTIAPPEGTNPFKVYSTDGTHTLERTEDPIACCFYEGRLVFGGTVERPYTIWLSATDSYLDFDERYVPVADGSIQFTLAARRYEQIRSVVGLGQLLVFTDTNVWAISGSGGAPLAGDDLIQARVQSEVGAGWPDPLVLGNSVLYAASRGGHVFDLAFSQEAGTFKGGDLSFLAQHLFAQDIVSWTYARQPWGLVWAVRADGSMLTCQYRSGATPGWTLCTTDGTYEDVCAIPEGDEDAVYVAVKRGNYRYIERMTTRVIDDVEDAICLDNAKTVAVTDSDAVTGLTHLEGEEVYCNAAGYVMGPYTVSGGAITLDQPVTGDVHVGLRYQPEMELLDSSAGRNREKRIKRIFVDVEASRGLFVGQDFDHLDEWKQRNASSNFDPIPLETGIAEVRTAARDNIYGRAVLRQVDPMPVTVTGFAREMEVGG